VVTRAEFALRMLDWWNVQTRDTLTIGASDGAWPLDCQLDVSGGTAVLRTPLLGWMKCWKEKLQIDTIFELCNLLDV
jgi:hypothetical protein